MPSSRTTLHLTPDALALLNLSPPGVNGAETLSSRLHVVLERSEQLARAETKRVQVHLSDEARVSLDLGESRRVEALIESYHAVVSRACPELSEAQWCAICDACNGLYISAGMGDSAPHLWAEVADCEGLGEKWGVDQAALVKQLRDLPRAALYAVADVSARFWERSHLQENPRAALLASGAKISGLD